MQTTYAITWNDPDGGVYSGKLEVRPRSIRLEGANGGAGKAMVVPLDELVALRVGRNGGDRLGDRPALVLELRRGSIKIASVAQPGILAEIAERIASLNIGRRATNVAVVVPTKPEARDTARLLVSEGPPFDPGELGLEQHRVFVTEREVVFVFEVAEEGALERFAADMRLLAAAAAWKDVIAGPPRVGELAYSWARAAANGGLSFEPTPGPGDSDGGDLYSP